MKRSKTTGKSDMLMVVQNPIQFYAVLPLLLEIKSQSLWNVDLAVDDPVDDPDFHQIANELRQLAGKYNVSLLNLSEMSGRCYKVCLAPYHDMAKVKYDYLLGYYYGSASSKPYPTFLPEHRMRFHGVFLHSVYDAEALEVYGKTYIVPNLRLRLLNKDQSSSKQNHHNKNKKTLLYLPTYGDVNGINEVADKFKYIRDDYHIIAKGHHGTEHLKSERRKKDLLRESVDEYYGPSTDINQLFEKADVVLSDNSGAIFDAMYIGVPIAIVANDINQRFGRLDTLQSRLVKRGIIPYSKTANEKRLKAVLQQALDPKTVKIQQQEAERLFPCRRHDVGDWIAILKQYMTDQISPDYIYLHDYYTQQNKENFEKVYQLDYEVGYYKKEIDRLNELLVGSQKINDMYRQGKLYRLASWIYDKKGRIFTKNAKK